MRGKAISGIMEIELSGNIDETIDEALFKRWSDYLDRLEQKTYRVLHELINDGHDVIDARVLAREVGTSRNKLFGTILPRLQSLGLLYFGSDDD